MKTNLVFSMSNGHSRADMRALANSKMLSNQIDNLRVVLRRMKKSDTSSSLDSLIDQKLKALE